MHHRALRRGVVPTALALLVLACCTDGGSTPPEGGGSFSVQAAEPEALAPTADCFSTDCAQIIGTVFTGLLRVDPETLEPVLEMAESIESEDGRTWTIELADGWTFHNGEPVDAQAFLRAWNYAAYGPNATATGFHFERVEGYDALQGKHPEAETLSGLSAVGEHTIEVRLSEPFSQWPLVMAYTPTFAPMAQECRDDIDACNEQPIGNGPYRFAGPWEPGRGVTVERYDDYQGEPGTADAIEFKSYPNSTAAFEDFRAGGLDVVTYLEGPLKPQAEALVGDRILQALSGNIFFFGVPMTVPGLDDKRVRQALSLAHDRRLPTEDPFIGVVPEQQHPTDLIPPVIPGGRGDACEYCQHDPDRARRLYAASGGIPGDRITVWYGSGLTGAESALRRIGEGWTDTLGLTYELRAAPFEVLVEALKAGTVDGLFAIGWAPDYPSPENYLSPVLGAQSDNSSGWSGPAYDRFLGLVAQGDAAASVAEGIPFYQQAADVALEELPILPLSYGATFIVYSERVADLAFAPMDQLLLEDVTVIE